MLQLGAEQTSHAEPRLGIPKSETVHVLGNQLFSMVAGKRFEHLTISSRE